MRRLTTVLLLSDDVIDYFHIGVFHRLVADRTAWALILKTDEKQLVTLYGKNSPTCHVPAHLSPPGCGSNMCKQNKAANPQLTDKTVLNLWKKATPNCFV